MNSTHEYTLEQLGTFEKSYSFSRALEGNGEYRHIHYGDIHTKLPSVIQHSDILPTITENQNFDPVKYGDILIADASEDYKDLGKAVCFLDSANTKVISGLHTHRFRPNSFLIKPEYLINLFQTNRYRKFVWKMGTGVSVLGLSKTNLAKYTLTIPCLDEQEKIAKHFMNLNKKIQLQQEKINLLKEQKKGYTQKIFSQEIRFKGENGQELPEWKRILVKDVLSLNLREVPKPTSAYTRLGLRSHARGTFHELVTDVKSINMDTLYEVHEGDFIINITFAWEQALAVADRKDHGKLVSHRFPTYRFKETHDKNFYKHFFTTKYFKYCLGNASPGGAGRNRVLNKTDFMEIEIIVPTLKEQIKISNFLDTLQSKINLAEQTLQALKDQKKSFMQKMFI